MEVVVAAPAVELVKITVSPHPAKITLSTTPLVHLTQTFITHDWSADSLGRSNHERAARLNEALKRAGVVTWFDSDRMTGSIRDKMAEGIANTSSVIVCVTKNYMSKTNGKDLSDNCKFELDYAFRVHGSTKLIPVVMEPGMRDPREWGHGAASAMLGGMLYIDLCSDEPAAFNAAVQQLVASIVTVTVTNQKG